VAQPGLSRSRLEDQAGRERGDADDHRDPQRRVIGRFRPLADNRSGPRESERSADTERGVADPGQRAGFVLGRDSMVALSMNETTDNTNAVTMNTV
jgi:hypothetical protein